MQFCRHPIAVRHIVVFHVTGEQPCSWLIRLILPYVLRPLEVFSCYNMAIVHWNSGAWVKSKLWTHSKIGIRMCTTTLSLDQNFAPFLLDGSHWEGKSNTSPLRGFIDDTDDIPLPQHRTVQQKVNMLELMLGQVANYCPVISRNTIIKTSTSVSNIW